MSQNDIAGMHRQDLLHDLPHKHRYTVQCALAENSTVGHPAAAIQADQEKGLHRSPGKLGQQMWQISSVD